VPLSRCTVARIHLHWLLGFYPHLFQGSRIRKMAPTVEAQVPAKTKPCPQIRTPPNPTVASNLSLRRGPHLRYGPRDRDLPSKTRQTRASSSSVTQRFPRPEGQNKSDPSQTLRSSLLSRSRWARPPRKFFTLVGNSGS